MEVFMPDKFESVDWGKELQTLVASAKTAAERKAAFAFAQAINPYLEKPELLKTLLGKIMQSPTTAIAIVAAQKNFKSLAEVQKKVGTTVNVVPL
jgi:hypothetical protein